MSFESPTFIAEQQWSIRLRELIEERARSSTEVRERRASQLRDERATFVDAQRQLAEAFDTEHNDLLQTQSAEARTAVAEWAARLASQDVAAQAALAEVARRYEAELQAAQSSRDDTTWLVGSLLDEQSADSPLNQLQRLQFQLEGTDTELRGLVQQAEERRDRLTTFLERCRMSIEVGATEPGAPPVNLGMAAERCRDAVAATERPLQQVLRMWLPRLFRGLMPLVSWVGFAALLAGPTWLLLDPVLLNIEKEKSDPGWIGIVTGGGAGIALVTLMLLHAIANQKVFGPLTEMFSQVRTAQAALARWQRFSREELERAHADFEHRHVRRNVQRGDALRRASSEFEQRASELTAWRAQERQHLESSWSAQRLKTVEDRDRQLATLQSRHLAARTEFELRRKATLDDLHHTHGQRLNQIQDQFDVDWMVLRQHWLQGIDELTATAARWSDRFTAACPRWDQVLERFDPQRPPPEAVSLGRLAVDLATLPDGVPEDADSQPAATRWSLPLMIDLQRTPALLLRARDVQGRQTAASVIQAAMLRLLSDLPPGRVRFTILDPVSLGESFATFMHLADVDELLVTTRIWTEPTQIEEQLANLTEHMETVLQMFLRNEFATLADYNEQAGEVAEPYRVLVVSGLPTNFSDISLRRLWSIVTSGARCGVIPLISVDMNQPIPRQFVLSDLEAAATVLDCQGKSVKSSNAELSRWPVEIDHVPQEPVFGQLVKELGRRAGDVRRVEVPFSRVAPAVDGLWTKSAARGIDVPIGRSGATRTQSVVLGSGTSQHVLIAGKTGSGKSTLLHALVTNAALNYSPAEVELYLIDFKKGVEFKVYSRMQLPHARVIGIESDREFGVSVLERLDTVLQERSAAFRQAGVQDLASFRQARPQEVMPRVLLIIDEFQEFFVEDDPLAHTASLLLDRLIRQGRAFGVHVLLGSQTLAGAYSLARSTLGQVAVRIALQCSESDAHLILSEENTAARLLTRPGEAIYNDANGMVSGNHLFQVVWLDDDERERYLVHVRDRARENPIPRPPAIVFEGNTPADLDHLPLWREGDKRHKSSGTVTAWLGEAVSLRGPLGLDFTASAGSHLLLVGQDETAAVGVLAGCSLSVTVGMNASAARLLVFNGSPQERSISVWDELKSTSTQVEIRDLSALEPTLKELVEEIRQRDARPGPRIWLCLFDLVRFRKLRKKDDDYGFGGFDKKEASPADLLAEILRDGPTVGVHAWIWCDSINTVNRWLSREMQQHLENRVAFAMNANDSSQLIDSPAASRLGPNRAWLFRGDRGTLDKFRPYHPPATGELSRLSLNRTAHHHDAAASRPAIEPVEMT